jgi:hypothetical protein
MEPRSTEVGHQQQQISLPQNLHHVWDESPKQLMPGEIIVLNESPALRSQVEPDFFAVLACPRCGVLNLVTTSQYFGASQVICGSNSCSCSFRIEDESRIVYLPVN